MLRMLAAIVVALFGALDCAATELHHELSIVLDPSARRLQVSDRITVAAGQAVALRLAARFRIEHLALDGRSVVPRREAADARSDWVLEARAPEDRGAIIEVRYSGELYPFDLSLDHRQVLGLAQPVAGEDAAFLPAKTGWYPHGERERLAYRMKVSVPAGVRPVAAGKVLAESATASRFEAQFATAEPLPGIDLMAGPYAVSERIVSLAREREVRVRTYFHSELAELAPSYLDSAAGYLRRFDAAIGAYPYATYSIVSSPLPTGFGMPGIAYLGRQVLRLPFIRTTSLGHEVLHDWWGNGVYPDYAQGNWSEGLTTFLADYAFKEDEGEHAARAMRSGWLRDFAAVRAENDRPLSAFVGRRHGADQAVGYSKSAFVLFMLRDLIGDEHFRAGLRRFWMDHRFRVASWEDLRRAFEAAAGRDLRHFFAQWITRSGAPHLEIASARRSAIGGRYRLSFELHQIGVPYRLNVPLRVHLQDGTTFDINAATGDARTRVSIDVSARPQALSLDPHMRIFRRLDRDEIAPILRSVMLDPRAALVLAVGDDRRRTTAHALARAMLEHAPAEWNGPSIDAAPPLLIVGLHPEVEDLLARYRLPGLPAALKARGTGLAYARRGPNDNVYVVVSARDQQALGALARALPHLGAQSFVAFEGARSVERGVWPVEPRRYPVTD